ncbi:MAG TPA: hypothetical protein VND92_03565, partial [Vicinamibacterales bacterium]|nr:hypothetical protein [Vicinamibacterales bacterium]
FGALRWLHRDGRARRRLAALPRRELVFNYLGRFDSGTGGAAFRPAPETAGATRAPEGLRPYLLEVNGGVTDGRLRLDWTYSTASHRASTIERLSERFVDALRLFADAGTPAESDAAFSDSGLSSRDLDRLLGRLK